MILWHEYVSYTLKKYVEWMSQPEEPWIPSTSVLSITMVIVTNTELHGHRCLMRLVYLLLLFVYIK